MAYPISYRQPEEMMEGGDDTKLIHQIKYLNNIVEQDHRAILSILAFETNQ